jgi:ADP-ribose pyrophosphatase
MSRVYNGRVISVDVDTVVLPNGSTATLERINHPGGAAVVAINTDGAVCLLSQYRHVTQGRIVELPAGKLEHGSPAKTAEIELAEEAGLRAQKWTSLGAVYTSPGVFTEVIHVYLAEQLTACDRAPEKDEDIEVFWLPLTEAVDRALSGEYRDGKTIIGLLRAQHHLLAQQSRKEQP